VTYLPSGFLVSHPVAGLAALVCQRASRARPPTSPLPHSAHVHGTSCCMAMCLPTRGLLAHRCIKIHYTATANLPLKNDCSGGGIGADFHNAQEAHTWGTRGGWGGGAVIPQAITCTHRCSQEHLLRDGGNDK
jgi:hypothetical protein